MKSIMKSSDHHGVSSEGVGPPPSLLTDRSVCLHHTLPALHHTLPALRGCLPQAHSGRNEISRAGLPSFQLGLRHLPQSQQSDRHSKCQVMLL